MNCINNTKVFLTGDQQEAIEDLKNKTRSRLGEDLFKHLTGTLDLAIEIASIHLKNNIKKYPTGCSGTDSLNKMMYNLCTAAILHDYGKIFKYSELVKIASEKDLGLSDFEMSCKPIIHSYVCPFLLQRDLRITDTLIHNAVRSHTIGSLNMNIIDRILYISDKIERSRDYEGIENLRKLCLKDLDLGLLEVYKSNIIYVLGKNSLLHPDTGSIWNYICGGFKNVS